MNASHSTIHITLNLSKKFMQEAKRIFKNKTKTQSIHEALQRMIHLEKMHQHFTVFKGKGAFKSHY